MISLNSYINIKKKVFSLSAKTKIIVVTKTFCIEKFQNIINFGHKDFGENRVQEAIEKWSPIKFKIKDIKLHLIGNLQSNKARDAVKMFDFIHSLSSEKLALTLNKEENFLKKKIKYFIQINLANEMNKNGIIISEADNFIKFCKNDLSLNIIGLMCIPPINSDVNFYFSQLKEIAHKNNLTELSMGMSGDFVSAIHNGATYVRIGSAIFGARKQ
jgi:pyridoxal phosphate enzyme (YggS family)